MGLGLGLGLGWADLSSWLGDSVFAVLYLLYCMVMYCIYCTLLTVLYGKVKIRLCLILLVKVPNDIQEINFTVLCCTILYFAVLYCTCCTLLYSTLLYCTVLYWS